MATALAGIAVIYAWRLRQYERSERRLLNLVDERTAELRERTAQLEVANAALEELATVDDLTGLANRRRFDVFLQQEWQRSSRSRQPLSLILVDIDFFKAYNDRYGHLAGDACLRQVASVLRIAATRPTDLTSRFGGEEFAVVMADTGREGAAAVAETIRRGVEALRVTHEEAPDGVVTVSVGVGTREAGEYSGALALLHACDRALYAAKRAGRNRTCTAGAVQVRG